MALIETYRPRRFEDVVGQDFVVRELSERVRHGRGGAYLFFGPIGTGKTSTARIFANGLLCTDKQPSGSPCLKCQACRDFERERNWFLVNGAEAQVEMVRGVIETLALVPLDVSHRILVFDEAHRLHPKTRDLVFSTLERLPSTAAVIMCTSEVGALPDDFRQRCDDFPLLLVEDAVLARHARRVCELESIAYDDDGLELLVQQAKGCVRELVKTLDALRDGVTVDRAQRELRLDFVDALVGYIRATCAHAPIKEQIAALGTWRSTSDEQRRILEEYLGYVFAREILGMPVTDKTLSRVPEVDAKTLVATIGRAAKGCSKSDEVVWERLIELVAPGAAPVTTAGLLARLNAIDRVIRQGQGESSNLSNGQVAPPQSVPNKSRRAFISNGRQSLPGGGSPYLTRAQVREIWEAASFGTQHYGVWLDLYGELRLPTAIAERAASAVGALTKGVASLSHGQDVSHWLYVHRRSGDGATVLLALARRTATVTQAALVDLLTRRAPWFSDAGGTVVFISGNELAQSAAQRQIAILRRLIGGLDPSVLDWGQNQRRTPLLDLLEVPAENRIACGPQLTPRRWGRSATIAAGATASALPVLSAFDDRAWGALKSGWEMDEHRHRRWLLRQVEALRSTSVTSVSLFDDEPHASSDIDLRGDPRLRPRAWPVWWAPPK